jgi:serine phosphatase RsbU (regulator of sigma subunit)
MQRRYFTLKDSVLNVESQKKILKTQLDFENEKKLLSLKKEQDNKNLLAAQEKKQHLIIIISVIVCLVILVVFFIFLYTRFKITKRQKVIIEKQNHLVTEKNREILDSISYAKRLQEAILPPLKDVQEHLKAFIYYKPKDIVAGDFYWMHVKNINANSRLIFFAVADSTGHGVPGALVSVVCSNALNRSVNEFGLTDPGKILDKTRELVLETFEKSDKDVKDGMDISLAVIEMNNSAVSSRSVLWSGANNPLWYFKSNEFFEIKADKQPVGKTDHPKPFTTHRIELSEGDSVYLFTDGYPDQFGGPNGKKFKYKPFSELVAKHQSLPPVQQQDALKTAFESWMNSLEQVDDVCVVGIKL